LPNNVKDELIKYIDIRLQEYLLANNDTLTISQFVNKRPRIFNEFMQDYNAKEYIPITYEGHTICISKSTYRVNSYFPVELFFDTDDKCRFMGHDDELKDGLRYDYLLPYDPNLMKQKQKYNSGDNYHTYLTLCYNDKDEQCLYIANFTLTKDRLYIECMSKERLESAKKLLAQIIDLGSIVHIGTTHEDMSHLAKRKSDEPDTVEEEKEKNSKYVKRMSEKFLKTYTLKWLDTNQDELDGMTPRQAAKTEDGKIALKELLKIIENQYERNKKIGDPYMDIHQIRTALGID